MSERIIAEGHALPGDGTIAAIVEPRERDLGGFTVHRILPAVGRRHCGPFVFLDAMGGPDMHFPAGRGVDVRPHPHIGLATVTYLFDGEIVHRDTLGSEQTITPGAINWMVAGRGIAHSERTGSELRKRGGPLHGLQLWVALPDEHQETAPSFEHFPASALPVHSDGGVALRLLAGTGWGLTAPARVLSPMYYADVTLAAGASLQLPAEHAERGVLVIDGSVRIGSAQISAGPLIVLEPGKPHVVRAEGPARFVTLGGEHVGERHIWWNFVSSSRDRIEAAKADWIAGAFGKVPGDEAEFIPLPDA